MELDASYETAAGSEGTVSFKGDLDDAAPLKDFLDTQFRVAADSDASITYCIEFNPPLLLHGDGTQRLIERLTRLVNPSAQVTAVIATDA